MNSDGYYTVFDITKGGFKSWDSLVFGLFFIVAGLVLIFGNKGGFIKTPKAKCFPFLFLAFAMVGTVASFLATFHDYRRGLDAMHSNRAEIVEGIVANFIPQSSYGTGMESFTVQGVRFKYRDGLITAGFNNTAYHGGPIREGLPVKIWHLNGEILRLDVKESNTK